MPAADCGRERRAHEGAGLGDIADAGSGSRQEIPQRDRMRSKIDHFFHLGALYDLRAKPEPLESTNIGGTRHALDLDHPYFRTKHEAEGLLRAHSAVPWRIYRPGMVVASSVSGAMDKIDGLYYLFKLIQKIREKLPVWVPLIGFEGGHINLVPVGFVAAALAHLAHAPGLDGKCFHLTDPADRRIGSVLNLFAKAAHSPTMSLRLESGSGSLRSTDRPVAHSPRSASRSGCCRRWSNNERDM